MFRKIINYFKKPEEEPTIRDIELSKIDKYVNLILRHGLASNNKTISDALQEIESRKESVMQQLHRFHKKSLMNPNIPQREIQIMDGNRDNFIKTISQFTSSIDVPKNYMDLYDYCVIFSEKIEQIYKTTQKNVFILNHFFENELKSINTDLNKIEEIIISIRVLFERHKVVALKEIISDVRDISNNLVKIGNLQHEIDSHKAAITDYADKIKKLEERIGTITSGTDFRALENFKDEKQNTQEEITKTFSPLEEKLLRIENALRKYYYRNPDKKIIKEYLEDRYKAFLNDNNLEISSILQDIKTHIDNDTIELKDKKKEQTIEHLNNLSFGMLKDIQSQLKKLEDTKQHLQTKITHNSASLNLSEQQYWINTNKEKIIDHQKSIEKLNGEVAKIHALNDTIKKHMKEDIETLFMENIHLIDDLSEDKNG
jgi:hypothetical protein